MADTKPQNDCGKDFIPTDVKPPEVPGIKTSGPQPTGMKVKDGPDCGRLVYMLKGRCLLMNVETKCWEELPEDTELVPCVAGDVQECVVGGKPERWCLNVDGLAGNGDPNSSYQILIPGDTEPTTLPVDFTVNDVIALYGDDFYIDPDDGSMCSTSGAFGINVSGITSVGEPPDIVAMLYSYVKATFNDPLPAIPGEVVKAQVTKGVNDGAILTCLQSIKNSLSGVISLLMDIATHTIKLCDIRDIIKKTKWQVIHGYDCATGAPVWWEQGRDCDGNIVFPNGGNCPTFYSGELITESYEQCECDTIGAAKAIAGIGETTFSITGSAGDHAIEFDAASGIGGPTDSALLDNNFPNAFLCVLNFGQGSFVFSPATLQGSNGSYTSSIPTATNNCEQELLEEYWVPEHNAISGTSATAGVNHLSVTTSNCQTIEPDCTAPLDPQPARVKIGAPPSDLSELCAKLEVTNEKLCDIAGDPNAPCPECPELEEIVQRRILYTKPSEGNE